MIKLRVFKKGPTYHRHTQKKTWAVFSSSFPVSFVVSNPKPPKKTKPPRQRWTSYSSTLTSEPSRFVQTSKLLRPTTKERPKEGFQPRSRLKVVLFEQHVGLAGESQMSQQDFLSYIRPRNRLDTHQKTLRSDGCLFIHATAEFPD